MTRPIVNALLLTLALAFAWPAGSAPAAAAEKGADKGAERQCFRTCIEKEGKDHRAQCRKRCAAEKGPAKDGKGKDEKGDKGKSDKAQECRRAFQACHKECGDNKECRQGCVSNRKTCMAK